MKIPSKKEMQHDALLLKYSHLEILLQKLTPTEQQVFRTYQKYALIGAKYCQDIRYR